jgi:hypothetical protein
MKALFFRLLKWPELNSLIFYVQRVLVYMLKPTARRTLSGFLTFIWPFRPCSGCGPTKSSDYETPLSNFWKAFTLASLNKARRCSDACCLSYAQRKTAVPFKALNNPFCACHNHISSTFRYLFIWRDCAFKRKLEYVLGMLTLTETTIRKCMQNISWLIAGYVDTVSQPSP